VDDNIISLIKEKKKGGGYGLHLFSSGQDQWQSSYEYDNEHLGLKKCHEILDWVTYLDKKLILMTVLQTTTYHSILYMHT
jgi:hypothetical protein